MLLAHLRVSCRYGGLRLGLYAPTKRALLSLQSNTVQALPQSEQVFTTRLRTAMRIACILACAVCHAALCK